MYQFVINKWTLLHSAWISNKFCTWLLHSCSTIFNKDECTFRLFCFQLFQFWILNCIFSFQDMDVSYNCKHICTLIHFLLVNWKLISEISVQNSAFSSFCIHTIQNKKWGASRIHSNTISQSCAKHVTVMACIPAHISHLSWLSQVWIQSIHFS